MCDPRLPSPWSGASGAELSSPPPCGLPCSCPWAPPIVRKPLLVCPGGKIEQPGYPHAHHSPWAPGRPFPWGYTPRTGRPSGGLRAQPWQPRPSCSPSPAPSHPQILASPSSALSLPAPLRHRDLSCLEALQALRAPPARSEYRPPSLAALCGPLLWRVYPQPACGLSPSQQDRKSVV